MQDPLAEPDEPFPDRYYAEAPEYDADAEERSPDRRVHKVDYCFACHRFSLFLSEEGRQRQSLPPYVFSAVWVSVEEIILIIGGCKVILSSGLASEGFAIADLLKVVQAACDPAVAVGIEGVQIDGCPAVHPGIDFRAFQDRIPVRVHDARCGCAVGVDARWKRRRRNACRAIRRLKKFIQNIVYPEWWSAASVVIICAMQTAADQSMNALLPISISTTSMIVIPSSILR